MKYIVHHRIKQQIPCGKEIDYPVGTEVECINQMLIVPTGELICYNTSLVGYMHFARNDDNKGIERGQLTYAIAYAKRIRQNNNKTRTQRFTDKEIEILCTKWNRFLRQDVEVILFNDDFFNADIPTLKEMAKDLHIKP